MIRGVCFYIVPLDPPQHRGLKKKHPGNNSNNNNNNNNKKKKHTPPNKYSIRQQFLQGITSFAAISFAQKSQSSQLGAHGWLGHRFQGDGKVYP